MLGVSILTWVTDSGGLMYPLIFTPLMDQGIFLHPSLHLFFTFDWLMLFLISSFNLPNAGRFLGSGGQCGTCLITKMFPVRGCSWLADGWLSKNSVFIVIDSVIDALFVLWLWLYNL